MATVYIVVGATGEWADREKWNVCFCRTREAAETTRDMCQQQGDEYFKMRHKKRPQRSFLRRHSHIRDEEYRAEEKAVREAMFDKFFSCDYTGTKYYVEEVGNEPENDPRWIAHQAWWENWQAERVAEQMKHCTVDDRSAFSRLGDLLKSKLTLR